MAFANSLDPYQACLNIEPNRNPNFLTLMVFLKEYFDFFLKKYQRTTKTMQNFPACKELKQKAESIAAIKCAYTRDSTVFQSMPTHLPISAQNDQLTILKSAQIFKMLAVTFIFC